MPFNELARGPRCAPQPRGSSAKCKERVCFVATRGPGACQRDPSSLAQEPQGTAAPSFPTSFLAPWPFWPWTKD